MKLWFVVWAGLWRKPARTIFTIVSLSVGFLLFGLLQGVDSAFDRSVDRLSADRLLTDPRFDDGGLPLAHASRIESVAGVARVTWTEFLPTYHQRPDNTMLVIATEPRSFFSIRAPEFQIAPETVDALAGRRTGLVVLDTLAAAQGWGIGDRVSLESSVARKDGGPWTFDVVGFVYVPDNPGQVPFAVANYDYLDEARASGTGTVRRIVLRAADPRRSVEVAEAIDALFANSAAPTRTQAESEIAQANLATVGDIGRMTTAVMGAVFFAIVFLSGNVVLQSVRERAPELAVLKTLGFSDLEVLAVVLLEALWLSLCGALLGLALTAAGFPLVAARMPDVSAWLGTPRLSPEVYVMGLGAAVVLTGLSAALPAWTSMRIEVADALRRRA